MASPSPAVLEEAILHVRQQRQRDKRVRAVTKATRDMLLAYDSRLRLSAGRHIERAKSYIASRCRALVGYTVESALQTSFAGTDGVPRSYRRADLNWDVSHDYLRVELVAPEGYDPPSSDDVESAQAAHLACMALSAGVLDPESHASAPQERATRLDALLAIVAMTDLPWDRYLAGPERQQVIEAWRKELQALLQLGAIVELVPGSPEWQEAVASASCTPCRVLLSFKRSGEWKARCVLRS